MTRYPKNERQPGQVRNKFKSYKSEHSVYASSFSVLFWSKWSKKKLVWETLPWRLHTRTCGYCIVYLLLFCA